MPTRFRVGGRIQDTLVPQAGGGPDVPLRGRHREGVVILFPRSGHEWETYLRAVAREAPALADWDGRAIVVAPDPDPAWARLGDDAPAEMWVVEDPTGVLEPAPASGTAASPARPLAVIADRFGEIYHVWDDDGTSPLPEPRELEQWLQFLALQCPE